MRMEISMKTYLWTCIYVSGPYLIYLDLCYCNLNATYLEFIWTCTLLECYCDHEIVSKFYPNSIEILSKFKQNYVKILHKTSKKYRSIPEKHLHFIGLRCHYNTFYKSVTKQTTTRSHTTQF